MKMTFLKWLKHQTYRNDPVGDLARDVSRDRGPGRFKTEHAWIRHLEERNACSAALAAVRRAWTEFHEDPWNWRKAVSPDKVFPPEFAEMIAELER